MPITEEWIREAERRIIENEARIQEILLAAEEGGDEYMELTPHIVSEDTDSAVVYPRFFDLLDVVAGDTNSFSIRGTTQDANYKGMASIAGVWKTIGVSGLTWDNSGKTWVSGDITSDAEDKWVLLKLDRQANTVTIVMANAYPDGNDAEYEYTEPVPLWYIPWDSGDGKIDTSNIEDMRDGKRLPAMA